MVKVPAHFVYIHALNDLSKVIKTIIQTSMDDKEFEKLVRAERGDAYYEGIRDAAASTRTLVAPIFTAILGMAAKEIGEHIGLLVEDEAEEVEKEVEKSDMKQARDVLKAFMPTGKAN
jgi:hypothetical protein